MATSRFARDGGLTARMVLTMLLLAGLFVGVVGGLTLLSPRLAPVFTAIAVAVVLHQWWTSDRVAMRAMRAREVTPDEAPELHGVVDRLCALADMPKPRVGIADLAVPNAFATGRSPDRAVVCVTTGILEVLDTAELEAVLAHELSHVAHRDVLVMTVAASAGITAGLLTRGLWTSGVGSSRSRTPAALITLAVALVVQAVGLVLLRVLSRYRELSADRAGAHLTLQPAQLASALQKISGATLTPERDLRSVEAASALCIVPALGDGGLRQRLMATHPPLQQRLEQLARIQAELGRPTG